MGTKEPKTPMALGFLTVVEHESHGFFGGYLVLNTNGRPLEFHCTAPIKPNRAQEILYGPTLQSYLYGEQIGQTLVAKSQVKPLVICTDQASALAVREFVSAPVALVVSAISPEGNDSPPSNATAAARTFRVDRAHSQPLLASFELGRNRLAISPGHDEDRGELESRLSSLADHFDLAEPFDRIRGAIEEAQRTGR
jgi:hypothetical protein